MTKRIPRKFWKEFFGFRVGDEVEIIRVSDACVYDKDWIGKRGRIVSIEQTRIGKDDGCFYHSWSNHQTRKIVTSYLVEIAKGSKIFLLAKDIRLISRPKVRA